MAQTILFGWQPFVLHALNPWPQMFPPTVQKLACRVLGKDVIKVKMQGGDHAQPVATRTIDRKDCLQAQFVELAPIFGIS